MSGLNTEPIVQGATRILRVWEANPDLRVGSLTLEQFRATLTGLQQDISEVEAKRHELTALLDGRDDDARSLRALNTRVLSTIRGTFGPDSAEYEQAGGVRQSERKRPARKAQSG